MSKTVDKDGYSLIRYYEHYVQQENLKRQALLQQQEMQQQEEHEYSEPSLY